MTSEGHQHDSEANGSNETPPLSGKSPNNGLQPSQSSDRAPSGNIQLPDGFAQHLESIGLDPSDPENALMVVKASFQSGLLPSAEELRAYSDASPEAMSKIIEWADASQTHRRELERLDFESSTRTVQTSQRNSLVIAIIGLLIGGALGAWGATTAAIVIAVAAVGGPSTSSILAQILSRQNLGNRNKISRKRYARAIRLRSL